MTPEIEARVAPGQKPGARGDAVAAERSPRKWRGAIDNLDSASALADFVAGIIDAKPSEKQEVLETIDVKERLDKVLALLVQRIEVLKLSKQIGEQTQQSLSSQQREHILREQLRQIQKELGEGDEKSVEIAELREAVEKAGMPKEAEDQAKKELKRLERMPEASAEYGMIRTYLDWLIELPWSKLDPGHDRHRRGAPHPRRGPLRPAQDQAAHPRISRGPQAQSGRQEPDPVLRRPARRRQDLARAEHRQGDRPQVRAAEPRRRARRGRDQGSPAHLYRRAAGQHHPVDPQGRHAQSGDDARRGGQARRRHSTAIRRRRCSKCSTPSRTRRSATTISAWPSISRR